MSLDIWLTNQTEEGTEEEVVSQNITHNLRNMWKEADVYDALYESEGKLAKDVLPTLLEGLGRMVDDPDRFKQHNATNGWGLYKHAVPWLTQLIVEFQKYPEGKIGISR